MARSGSGRGARSLNKNKKGKGKAGSKWGHNFQPKNAVARKLKNKTFKQKGTKARKKAAGRKRG